MTQLSVEDLHKRYGDHEVLKGVSLDTEAGDVVSIIGSSGSGKSTFLRCINFLEQPDAGRITVGGEEIRLVPDRNGHLKVADARQLQRLRTRLAMVFQHFNLWAHMTVLENVTEAPVHVLGLTRAEARERAEAYLEKVGIAHFRDSYPAHLSGGQQQRVAIARALVNNPAVILADEPTGNLDSSTSAEIMNLFTALNQQGITIIMVTHEQDVAAYAGRQITFRDGKIISDHLTGQAA